MTNFQNYPNSILFYDPINLIFLPGPFKTFLLDSKYHHQLVRILYGGLVSALRDMAQANIDLGILQETKLSRGVHTQELVVFCIVISDAPIFHLYGVALFYKYP